MTPAEFVRARLDEREAVAPSEHVMDWPACDAAWPDAYPAAECRCRLAQRRARVLREVAALRAVVDALGELEDAGWYASMKSDEMAGQLASIWSDHEDYDPTWKPAP
jgi:hypothetical protein